MQNKDYLFFLISFVLLIAIIYHLVKDLLNKDLENSYNLTQTNIELIEALRHQNKEINTMINQTKNGCNCKRADENQTGTTREKDFEAVSRA
jgi:F0F1-type ATP synthase membrane subunit b/b'